MASKKLGNVLGSTLKMIKADRKIYPKEKIPTITRESFCFFKTLSFTFKNFYIKI